MLQLPFRCVVLLSECSFVDLLVQDGNTPLMLAAASASSAVLELVLAAVDPSKIDFAARNAVRNGCPFSTLAFSLGLRVVAS